MGKEADVARMIGRSTDQQRVHEALRRAAVVSILGTAGIGKTTLARAVLTHWRTDGDAVWVDLTEARSLGDVCEAVCRTLGGRLGEGGGLTADRTGAMLASVGPCLVVLDNFEGVVSEAAVLARWAERAPDTRFLVTTQARLRIRPERCIELAPLERQAAVSLFVETASTVLDAYAPDDDERAQIERLVELVDRLPLGVVLLGCRRDVLRPEALLERVERVGPPDSPYRDTPDRHVSMTRALESSWALLSGAEQQALAQLSVFRGGFDLALADGVVDVPGHRSEDLVLTLRDRSLLVTRDGALPLTMLTCIHRFAAEHLDTAPGRAARERMARAILARAEPLLAGIGGPDDARCSEGLRALADNLRAVVELALDAGEPLVAHRAGGALAAVVYRRGPYIESLPLLRRILEAPGASSVPPLLRARLRIGLGQMLRILGRYDEAIDTLTSARDLARQAGVRPIAAMAGAEAGYAAEQAGWLDQALSLSRDAMDDAGAEPRPLGVSTGVHGLAMVGRGEDEEGLHHMERCLTLLRGSGDARILRIANIFYGVVLHATGRLDEARHVCEARTDGLRGGDRTYALFLDTTLGAILLEAGELDRAAEVFAAATREALALGALHEWAKARSGAGAVAAARDDLEAATGAFEDLDHVDGLDLPPWLQRVVGLRRGHLALARARRGARAGEAIDDLVTPVARRVDAPSLTLSERIARRTLRRDLDGVRTIAAGLVVLRDEGVVKTPDGDVDLSRHTAMRNICWHLVQARLDQPGHPVSADVLIAQGWPGEQILEDAATKRLHTAIASLRRKGLRPYLITRDEGYLLDPDQACTWG